MGRDPINFWPPQPLAPGPGLILSACYGRYWWIQSQFRGVKRSNHIESCQIPICVSEIPSAVAQIQFSVPEQCPTLCGLEVFCSRHWRVRCGIYPRPLTIQEDWQLWSRVRKGALQTVPWNHRRNAAMAILLWTQNDPRWPKYTQVMSSDSTMNEQPVNRQQVESTNIYNSSGCHLLLISEVAWLRHICKHGHGSMDSTQSSKHLLASTARHVVSTAPHSGRIPMTCRDEKKLPWCQLQSFGRKMSQDSGGT